MTGTASWFIHDIMAGKLGKHDKKLKFRKQKPHLIITCNQVKRE